MVYVGMRTEGTIGIESIVFVDGVWRDIVFVVISDEMVSFVHTRITTEFKSNVGCAHAVPLWYIT